MPYFPPGGGGVDSFNGREGVVALTKGDVTGTGLAAADVAAIPAAQKAAANGVASLDAGGAVPAGQLANVPAGALTHSEGVIPGNVAVAGAQTTQIMATGALAPGTWLVAVTLALFGTGSAAHIDAWLEAGSATVSGELGPAQASTATVTSTEWISLTFIGIVTVTAAGTLNIKTQGSNAYTVEAASSQIGRAGVTGYVAVKIG